MRNQDNDNIAAIEADSAGSFVKWQWGKQPIYSGKRVSDPKSMYLPKKDKDGKFEFKPDFK